MAWANGGQRNVYCEEMLEKHPVVGLVHDEGLTMSLM